MADVAVLATIGALPLATLPTVLAPGWSPKVALVLAIVPLGLVRLVQGVARRELPFVAGLAFLAAVWLSVGLSATPVASAIGRFAGFTSGVMFTAFVAAWAAATALTPPAARALPKVVAAAGLTTAGIVWAQAWWFHSPTSQLMTDGRPAALAGNPVYTGGFLAGMLVMVVARWASNRPLAVAAVVALLTGAINLTGSRAALAAGLVVTVVAAVAWHRFRLLLVVAALAVGVLLSLAPLGATSSTARTAQGGDGGLSARTTMWRLGFDAWTQRPVTGWGPGRFGAATTRHVPVSFTRGQGGTYFDDAHNSAVELLTCTGIVGLAAAGWWLTSAGRRADPTLRLAAVGFGLTTLLEPNMAMTAVFLTLLGASSTPRSRRQLQAIGRRPVVSTASRRASATVGVALVLGLALSGTFLVGTAVLLRSYDDGSVADARTARRLLPPWPEVRLTQIRAELATGPGPEGRDAWLHHLRHLNDEARQLDPARGDAYRSRGEIERLAARPASALRWYQAALVRSPWDVDLLTAIAGTARTLHRPEIAAEALATRRLVERTNR